MRIAVFGAGGVGGYFGGRLAQAGEQVIFIARGEHLRAMQEGGLRVDSLKGDFTLPSVQATEDPGSVGEVDAVLVAVKAWQVPQVAAAIKPLVGPETVVLPLENGVEAPEQLAAVLGEPHVLGGLCKISTFLAGPGHIRHVGLEPYVALGELDNRLSERVERLARTLRQAGVTVEVPADIQAAMWEKFVFIASISGVGAVTRVPVGVMRSVPETRRLLDRALQEVAAVGRGCGVNLGQDTAARVLANIDSLAPGVTASMQRDIMEGRPSELEAQNGAVVRMGRQAGVDTPVHEFLYASLLPLELKARA